MTVRELLKTDKDIDIYDNVCEELGIAVCCPLELTPEGEKEFEEVLGYPVEINPCSYGGYPAAILLIDGSDWEDKLKKAERFFYSAAGYCNCYDYDRWFA